MSVNMPTPHKELKLYTSGFSTNALRAELYLKEKGLGYERINVDLTKDEQKKPEYLKINPRGQVPCLHAYGTCVHESVAIMQFLEHMNPNKRSMLPKDTADLARCFERIHEFQQKLDPTNFLGGVLFRNYRMPAIKEKVDKMMAELENWEEYLNEDDYLAGDNMTMVDLVVFPFISSLTEILKLPIQRKFPSLGRWYDDIKMRPSVQSCKEYWEGVDELASNEGVNVLQDVE